MPATRKRPAKAAKNTKNAKAKENVQPIPPCGGPAHAPCPFHRLKCGHIVKTTADLTPEPCATNCAWAAANDDVDDWGPHPFECPICLAKSLATLWRMDVVALKQQLPSLSIYDFADWVYDNYKEAWEKRRWTRLARWVPNGRGCAQLRMTERCLVALDAGEEKPPYAIEKWRRLYERREVHADFWNHSYVDSEDLKKVPDEAEPGVVYQSIEVPGVHFKVEPLETIPEEEEDDGEEV